MDSMMRSPSAEPASNLDDVDFAALTLEPAMQSSGQNTHSIFAFESGATWGSSNTAGHNDWGFPRSSANAFSNSQSNGSVVSASFLSLSNSNTWGGVPGLSDTTLGGSSLQEHAGSTATGD
eukprot:scaffold13478_cov132-Cylindrotheca_fusiformis.AAC.39